MMLVMMMMVMMLVMMMTVMMLGSIKLWQRSVCGPS